MDSEHPPQSPLSRRDMSQQIHFVHETKPGSSLDATQIRALRSHVRKVNLERSNQKSTQRLENFRSLTITDFSEGSKFKGGKRRRPSSPGARQSPESEIEELPLEASPTQLLPLPSPVTLPTAFRSLSLPEDDYVPGQCTCGLALSKLPIAFHLPPASSCLASDGEHPYARQVSQAIGLDEARIGYLLNSCKFVPCQTGDR